MMEAADYFKYLPVEITLREEDVHAVVAALSYVNHEQFQFLARNIRDQAESQGVEFS